MKLIMLDATGIHTPRPVLVTGLNGSYWAIHHGQHGPRMWNVRISMPSRYYPPAGAPRMEEDFTLSPTGRHDKHGQPLFTLAPGQDNGKTLVLWDPDPATGPDLSQTYGEAETLCRGIAHNIEAHGLAVHDCPVILVSGDAALSWASPGAIYTARCVDGDRWDFTTQQTARRAA